MKNKLVLFLMTLLVSAMISCTDSANDSKDAQQLEELRAQITEDMNNSPNHPDKNQTATTRAIPGGGIGGGLSFPYYNAYMKYDYDCDGVFEVGVNEKTATWSCCWDKVAELAWNAMQNGWCYDYEPELQCQQFSSSKMVKVCPG